MALTYRAGLLAAAGIAVVALLMPSRTGMVLVTLGVLALVGLDVAMAGSVRRLEFARSGGTAVRLGETTEVGLRVTNPGRRRVRGLLRDAWPPSAGVVEQRFAIDLPPGEGRRLTTTLRPIRRGDRHAARVTVRALGPLGLAGRQGSHRVPWTVRALPAFRSRTHLPSRLARLRELDGRTAVLVRGQGTEFDSLREYVVGDDVRSIDWRATARRSDVVVRTWRPERDRHVMIVLDTGRTSAGRIGVHEHHYGGTGGDIDGTGGLPEVRSAEHGIADSLGAPRLDYLMDAALLLAALATRAGDRVDLLAYDRRAVAAVQRAGPQEVLPRFTDALAQVDSSLVELDHHGLAAQVLRRAGRRSLVVLLTGLDAAVIEEGLLPAIGPLLKRHHVLIGAVADPAVAMLAAGRGDADAVYAAAAAERDRSERGRVTTLLRRRGITVVDALPDRIAPDLADTYLALKRAGRL